MDEFPEWLTHKFEEWEKTTGHRQPYIAFARYLGTSQPTLNRWMAGDVRPTGDNVRLLADKLGPGVYDVLGITPPLPEPLMKISAEWQNIPPDAQVQLTVDLSEFIARWLEEHGFYRVK